MFRLRLTLPPSFTRCYIHMQRLPFCFMDSLGRRVYTSSYIVILNKPVFKKLSYFTVIVFLRAHSRVPSCKLDFSTFEPRLDVDSFLLQYPIFILLPVVAIAFSDRVPVLTLIHSASSYLGDSVFSVLLSL